MRTRTAAVLALAVFTAAVPTALAHQGNPNYLSQVDAITPARRASPSRCSTATTGCCCTTRAARTSSSRDTTTSPTRACWPTGRSRSTRESPAYYLNDDRFGDVKVPTGADGKGAPQWKEIDKTGRFEWHDHRMHWMAKPRRRRSRTSRRRRRSSTGRCRRDRRRARARSPGRCSGRRCPAAAPAARRDHRRRRARDRAAASPSRSCGPPAARRRGRRPARRRPEAW